MSILTEVSRHLEPFLHNFLLNLNVTGVTEFVGLVKRVSSALQQKHFTFSTQGSKVYTAVIIFLYILG